LNFIRNKVGQLAGKQILDIGCATGELAFQLAQSGARVTGMDLNEDLLQQAKKNKAHPDCTFLVGNMLDLEKYFATCQFDAVLCFGNTLVHLEHKEQIRQMFQGVYSVLQPGGYFLIQILNYDYIFKEQITELPIIESENIKFIRKYKFGNHSDNLIFQTHLFIKPKLQEISNETQLLALKSKDLKDLLNQANFAEIEFYSNFKMDSFGGNHLPLVLICRK